MRITLLAWNPRRGEARDQSSSASLVQRQAQEWCGTVPRANSHPACAPWHFRHCHPSDSAWWKSGLKFCSCGLELQNLVMSETKAVLFLPQDKCKNDVWQCHGQTQTATRFVCHVCLNHIAAHLTLINPRGENRPSGLEPNTWQSQRPQQCFSCPKASPRVVWDSATGQQSPGLRAMALQALPSI